MIRRQSAGLFHLITQQDHATLSGHLARQIGNDRFAPLDESVISAISLHDAGWPLHDDSPTLNPQGFPRDVFESTPDIAIPVWTASADRAQESTPYAGLLVSLHVLALSAYATEHLRHNTSPPSRMKDQFALNQFQHHEVERQERLRQSLNLPTNLPLTYGLAQPNLDPREDLLRYHFRLLQAMDTLSLAICCTEPPAPTTQDLHPHPGAPPIRLTLHRKQPDLLIVEPWPFCQARLTFNIPAKRMAAEKFESEASFRMAYPAAPVENLSLTLAVTS